MRSVHLLAVDICQFLDAERVEYVLLGDARTPAFSGSQRIELAIAPETLPQLPLLLHRFCQAHDARLVECYLASSQTWRAVVSWLNRTGHPDFATLEIFGEFSYRGRVLLTAAELLQGRHVEEGELRLRPAFFVATAAHEFIYFLLRCVQDGRLSDEQTQHLRECWREDPTGAAEQIARFWAPQREGGMLQRAAESGDWAIVQANLEMLRAAIARRRFLKPWQLWREFTFRLRRPPPQPVGLLLACLGPQGIGKGEVIAALKARPLAPFSDVHTMELRPRIFRPKTQDLAVGQRRQRPRGRAGTIAKLVMFALDYWLGFWTRIRPRLARGMLVVSNRYFDDVLVDPLRYRMARPFAFARALLPWVPRPDLWLVLDAPAEVISSRSKALSEEESSRQRGEYRRLLRGYENVVVLDARQSLQQVVAAAERAIVAHLENRTAERLGLPVVAPRNPLATRILMFFSRHQVPILSRLVRIVFNSELNCRLPAHIYMPHPYGIVLHSQAAIGERVTIMQQVAIGDAEQGEAVAPVIGNDVYIGAGARVLGDVRIGDGVTIGANAVVTRDIPSGATVVGANRILTANGAGSARQLNSVSGGESHAPGAR
jgi:serine acetyltransferase/thymidylate kinase